MGLGSAVTLDLVAALALRTPRRPRTGVAGGDLSFHQSATNEMATQKKTEPLLITVIVNGFGRLWDDL